MPRQATLEPIETAYHRLLRQSCRRAPDVQTAVCPKCGTPLTVCVGATGPYFHCRCLTTRRPTMPAAPPITPTLPKVPLWLTLGRGGNH